MRNLKALGLALIAVFALGAMTASAATAQGVVTGANDFWIHGTDEGLPAEHPLTAFGGEVRCTSATYTGGEVQEETEVAGDHNPLPSGSSAFTLTPHYSGCTNAGGLPETVTMNGCDYDIEIGETIEAGKYDATANLVCPEGKEVTIDIYGNATAHAAGSVLCTVHIPKTTKALGGGYIEDQGDGTLTVGGSFGPFPATLTGPSACTPQTVTDPNATLHVEMVLTGRSAETGGTEKDISLSD